MGTSKNALKQYFLTGAKPTQPQFAELIDAFRHVDEALTIAMIQGLSLALADKASQAYVQNYVAENGSSMTAAEVLTALLANPDTFVVSQEEKNKIAAAGTVKTVNGVSPNAQGNVSLVGNTKLTADTGVDFSFDRWILPNLNGTLNIDKIYNPREGAVTTMLMTSTDPGETANLAGTVEVAAGDLTKVTGTGTQFATVGANEIKAGDIIIIGGVRRVVSNRVSNTELYVSAAFPAVVAAGATYKRAINDAVTGWPVFDSYDPSNPSVPLTTSATVDGVAYTNKVIVNRVGGGFYHGSRTFVVAEVFRFTPGTILEINVEFIPI